LSLQSAPNLKLEVKVDFSLNQTDVNLTETFPLLDAFVFFLDRETRKFGLLQAALIN
jgi:hypothetical protein